ncbi:TIGR03943 family protein [Streptomyces sp. 549]|uniref:TIGR03943 family putative permease subunit n=1 Tax=Streptomyces sp. 549 TaxID=3049076 RepID=UPI0024C3ABB1|nr:TIGR03943 family protein [Streptomyces sp. 549]MDK1472447.1 TIGR03943 family protein [Streptomyces sp. 549]
MRRNVQTLVVLLAGAAMLHVALLTDMYLRYVKEGLRPFLIASGVLLIVLGLIGAARDGFPFVSRGNQPPPPRDVPASADEHSGSGHDHGHHHDRPPLVAWLLLVPVLALLLFPPPPLGSYTASRDGGLTVELPSKYGKLPASDPVRLSMTEFTGRVTRDDGNGLDGRTVALTGFVTPRPGGGWFLTRHLVSCCAADSVSLKVRVHGAEAPPVDTWIVLTGTWRPGTGDALAVDAAAVTPVPTPANPYGDTAPPAT